MTTKQITKQLESRYTLGHTSINPRHNDLMREYIFDLQAFTIQKAEVVQPDFTLRWQTAGYHILLTCV